MIPAYTCPILGDFPALDMPIEDVSAPSRAAWSAMPTWKPLKVRGYGVAQTIEEFRKAVGNG